MNSFHDDFDLFMVPPAKSRPRRCSLRSTDSLSVSIGTRWYARADA